MAQQFDDTEMVWTEADDLILDTYIHHIDTWRRMLDQCKHMILLLQDKARTEWRRSRRANLDRTLAFERMHIYRGIINKYKAVAAQLKQRLRELDVQ